MNLRETLQRRAQLVNEVKALVEKAKGENRDLNENEKQLADAKLDFAAELREQVERAQRGGVSNIKDGAGFNREERLAAATAWGEGTMGRKTDPADPIAGNGGNRAASVQAEFRGPIYRDAKTGKEYRALLHGEKMSDYLLSTGELRADEQLSPGKAILGAITGNWNGAEGERRAMLGSSDVAGGYLLTPYMSSIIVDLARAKSVTQAAGAQTLPMPGNDLLIATVDSDPTGTWRPEGTVIPTSEPTFGQMRMRARAFAILVPMSIELAEDAPNAAQLLEAQMAAAIGQGLDYAVLRGGSDGVHEQPTGIRVWDNVQEMASIGAPTYADISEAVQKVEAVNGTPNALVWHPNTAGYFDRLVDSTGQPLKPLASFERLKKFTTTSIPVDLGTAKDETEVYLGDFSQIIIGMRTQITIEASRTATSAESGSAFQKMMVLVRAYIRADVACLRQTHMVRMLGVTPA